MKHELKDLVCILENHKKKNVLNENVYTVKFFSLEFSLAKSSDLLIADEFDLVVATYGEY